MHKDVVMPIYPIGHVLSCTFNGKAYRGKVLACEPCRNGFRYSIAWKPVGWLQNHKVIQ
jgi:hypothetical protein